MTPHRRARAGTRSAPPRAARTPAPGARRSRARRGSRPAASRRPAAAAPSVASRPAAQGVPPCHPIARSHRRDHPAARESVRGRARWRCGCVPLAACAWPLLRVRRARAVRVVRVARAGPHRSLFGACGVDGGHELDVLRRRAAGHVPRLVRVRVRAHADHLVGVLIEVKHLQLVGVTQLERGDEEPVAVSITLQRGQCSRLPFQHVRGGSIELEHVRSQPRGRIEMSRWQRTATAPRRAAQAGRHFQRTTLPDLHTRAKSGHTARSPSASTK